jgi:hypothetical protein
MEELTKPSFNISDSGIFFLYDQHVVYFRYESEPEKQMNQLYVLNLVFFFFFFFFFLLYSTLMIVHLK